MAVKKTKKSQIAIQFNWIFILIAGALILIFFIGVVYKIRSSSQETLACNVLSDLEAIITGASVSTGTSNLLDTPEIAEIEFTCEQDGFSQYNIKGSGCKKDTPIEPIFAPNLIKGKKLITWALEFSAPFKVDNFLFLTHPEVKYVFVCNRNDPVKQYFDSLPNEINKQWIESTASQEFQNIKQGNNYKFKFIFGGIQNSAIPDNLEKLSKKDISQITIYSNKIGFREKSGNSFGTEEFVPIIPGNLPSIYAAIFSQDKESYECNMKKIYKRLAIISDVYYERTKALKQQYSGQFCEPYYYTEEFNDLVSLKQSALECSANIQASCISGISMQTTNIYNANQNLKRASCPMMY